MSMKAMRLSECLNTYADAVSFLLTRRFPTVPRFVRIHVLHSPKKQVRKARSPGVWVHEVHVLYASRRHDLHRHFLIIVLRVFP
jgi:hypothetical protein